MRSRVIEILKGGQDKRDGGRYLCRTLPLASNSVLGGKLTTTAQKVNQPLETLSIYLPSHMTINDIRLTNYVASYDHSSFPTECK